jgi:hypothetical protein
VQVVGTLTAYPSTPPGWTVVERRTAGRFTTALTFRRPDGRLVEWSSRRHRKHASRLSRAGRGDRALWAPRRASWWIAVLFMLGSSCFVVAPLPAYLSRVGGQADGATFFVGSLLFTSAAFLQWLETINADPRSTGPGRAPSAPSPGSRAASTGGAAGCSSSGRSSSTSRRSGR